jgi:hypothetical protein
MRASVPRATLTCVTLICCTVLQTAAQTTAIGGRVVDFATEAGIGSARVELLDAGGRRVAAATADSAGGFIFRGVRPGLYRLAAESLGYQRAVTPEFAAADEGPVGVIVRLAVGAVPLAPLEVTTRPIRLHPNPGLADLYRRAERGMGGTFVMREELEQRSPANVIDLLYEIPGFTFLVTNQVLVSNRAQCGPAVYLDGRNIIENKTRPAPGDRAGYHPNESFKAVNSVPAIDLEAVEVYASAASVPAEYAGANAMCGVIALWSKRGLPRR